jgi:hypothetical protein
MWVLFILQVILNYFIRLQFLLFRAQMPESLVSRSLSHNKSGIITQWMIMKWSIAMTMRIKRRMTALICMLMNPFLVTYLALKEIKWRSFLFAKQWHLVCVFFNLSFLYSENDHLKFIFKILLYLWQLHLMKINTIKNGFQVCEFLL